MSKVTPVEPVKFDQRIRVFCPSGQVAETRIEFEDGTPLKNVLRAVISMESPRARGANGETPDGKCYVFVTRYDAENGHMEYGFAEALVGAG